MKVPVLIIVIPLIAGVILFVLRKRILAASLAAAIFCLIMSLVLVKLPLDTGIPIGKLSVNFSSTWTVLGRRFVVEKSELPFLTMIFALGGIWFLAARLLGIIKPFAPIGVGILGLLCAAMTVEPFIYAGLIFELITLILVTIMVERGKPQDNGSIKYLIYQTLGFPFILFTGWVLNVAGVNPSDQVFLIQAILFLGLGFALWLGVFPFYSWVPLLVEGANPLIAGFTLSMIPAVILLLIIDFLNGFAWLRDAALFYTALSVTGLIMVVSAGIFAAFSKNLARLLGYAVIIQTGLSLIAIGLHSRVGLEYLILAMLPGVIAIIVWSTGLTQTKMMALKNNPNPGNLSLQNNSISMLAIFFALFSLAGVPGLGSFSLKLGLLSSFAKTNPGGAFWALAGLVGLLVGGARQLVLIFKDPISLKSEESLSIRIFLIISIAALLLIGLFPRLLLSNLSTLVNSFKFLNWQ